MDNETLAIALTFLVHVLGVGALIWHLVVDADERPDWRGWFRDEDDPEPAGDSPAGPAGGGLPLPDALPSAVRLREPGRLADTAGRPARRPAHAPGREPQREPAAGAPR